MSDRLGYRPEIDGLRAIAVLAVVLFHAGVPGFGGGFVGVDIFFVISGFLITSIVATGLSTGSFTFSGFYERRARRILPAFLAMLAFCCAVAPFLLLPDDFQQFVDSVVASVLFVSNMLFARHYDYFGQTTIFNPLLHTWSLAVEEQFYLLLPLLMAGTMRFWRGSTTTVVAAIALVSFALSVWLVQRAPAMAYFIAPTRAWELLLGSLLALGALPAVRRPQVRAFLSLLGLLLIVGSIALLSEASPFPGINALYPCLGAVLLLHGEQHGTSACGRLLRLRGLVFVGMISYSLYLWHWPLLVFARYYIIRELTVLETGSVVLAAFVAAILSWHYVERPFRGHGGVAGPARVLATAGGLTAAFLLVGLASHRDGPAGVLTAFAHGGGEQHLHRNPDFDRCIGGLRTRRSRTPADVRAHDLCPLGDPGAVAPSFVLWGDSHAEAIRAGVDAAARAHDVSGYYAGLIDCPPAVGIGVYETEIENGCRDFNDAVMELLQDSRITTVIMHARWARLYHGTKYHDEPGVGPLLITSANGSRNEDVLASGLRTTVARLQQMGKRIFIVAAVPEVGVDVPSFLSRARYLHRDVAIDVPLNDYTERNAEFVAALHEIAATYSVSILYPHQLLCDSTACRVAQDGKPLYHDDDHLSMDGALFLERMFAPAFMSTTASAG